MNIGNVTKSGNYKLLASYFWLSHAWVKWHFIKNWLDIANVEDVRVYIDKKIQQVSWVYMILNKVNWKRYYWTAYDFLRREKGHFFELEKWKHHNKFLQYDFNMYWRGNFEFIVIEKIKDKTLRYEKEKEYIENSELSSIYNIENTIRPESLRFAIFIHTKFLHKCLKNKEKINKFFSENKI